MVARLRLVDDRDLVHKCDVTRIDPARREWNCKNSVSEIKVFSFIFIGNFVIFFIYSYCSHFKSGTIVKRQTRVFKMDSSRDQYC